MERILIVANEGSLRVELADLIESQGFRVEEAGNGPDALYRLASAGRYHLVVSDIQLPGMDGLELVRRIVRSDPTMLAVLVGEAASESRTLEGLRAGAFDFLAKPVSVREFREILRRASERRRATTKHEVRRGRLEGTDVDHDSEIRRTHQTLIELHRLGQSTYELQNLEPALEDFAKFAMVHFHLDTFGVLVLENSGFEKLIFADRFGRDLDPSVLVAGSDLCRAVLERSSDLLRPPHAWRLQKKNQWARYWGFEHDHFAGLIYAGSDYSVEAPVELDHDVFGFFRNRVDSFLREHYIARQYKQQQRRMFVASIQAHARSIEAKDVYTAGHCDRVERYAELLARQAGEFSEEWIFNLRVGAILHDIGKIGVPSALLCKPGVLDPDEQHQIQSHPVIGSHIVRAMQGFTLESSVRHHHERYDGTGYPDRLKGDGIPIEARLILAADTFDAMTSNRPYRRALSTERALTELEQFSGKQFDPEVVKLMTAAAPLLEAAQKSSGTVNSLKDLAESV